MAAPTFSLEQVNEIVRKALEEQKASKPKLDYDKLCISACRKRGFDAQPRVNVLTWGKWIEQGRIVRDGERSIPVRQLRLFHYDQTRPLVEADKKKLAEKQANKAKVTPKSNPGLTPLLHAAVAKASGQKLKAVPQQPQA